MGTVGNSELSGELMPVFEEISKHANAIMALSQKIVPPEMAQGGVGGAYVYEFSRRMEEAMHRIGDMLQFRLRYTAEHTADVTEAAIKAQFGGKE